ncbi:MAG: hypothetical protein II225_00175, partial [Ruminococcus sp.]|nr:hypothetical protein [Ruminococcus sp.]
VGIQPSAFYRLEWWQLRSIIRGYNRRRRDGWSQTRWHAYNVMQCFADLRKAGINRPADLIKFTWERVAETIVSEDDIKQLQAEMAAMNAQASDQNK